MRLSARGAQKTRNESKKLSMYSKQWAPGDTLRVLYPVYWENGRPELAVGAVWGHSVSDIKGLGLKTAFIPSTNSFNEDGEPIGPADITYQFSMIAGAFVQGSTMELSADGPIREPYAVYFQGGLTWYHAKLGILMSLQKMVDAGLVNI